LGIFLVCQQIENKKYVVVDATGGLEQDWEQFCSVLRSIDAPRYAVVDVEFQSPDGRPQSKIVFVSWIPEQTSVMQKMLYSATLESFRQVLRGIMYCVKATDEAELSFSDNVFPLLMGFAR
jgi:cofilin